VTAYPFEAEVRLLRWAESSNAGRTVTFELPPGEGEAHPFRGLTTGHQHGQRFRMLFQAIDDNEEPIRDPGETPESCRPDEAHSPGGFPPEPPTPAHPAGIEEARKLAVAEAGRLANREAFQQFASRRSGVLPPSPEVAASFIRAMCGVGSRKEIAISERAYQAFLKLKTDFEIAIGRIAEPRR
jgi:hypothetical protein